MKRVNDIYIAMKGLTDIFIKFQCSCLSLESGASSSSSSSSLSAASVAAYSNSHTRGMNMKTSFIQPLSIYRRAMRSSSYTAAAGGATTSQLLATQNDYTSSNLFGTNSPFSMGTKTDPNEFFDLSKSKPKVVSVSPASTVKNIPDDLMSTTTNNSIIISNNDRNNNTTTDDNNDNDTQTKQDSSTAQIIKTQNKKINKTQLKEDLKQYRMQQANYNKKPAYTIFTNAALDGIYKSMPTTRDELLDVKGIGPMKADLYGDDILAIVSNYKRLGISSSSTSTVGPGAVVTARARIDPTTLTLEQRLAAEIPLGKEQRNVFITGSAGTGKSYLLKYIVEELRERKKGTPNSVAICAPTGVAAIIVGGSTLHSFFGIGLGQGSIPSLLKKVNKNSGAKKRIDETDILIIDECSMLSADLLEKLDAISREIRKDGKFCEVPFGGMQIIAFGDFFQLPPVVKRDSGGFNDRRHRPFCFDSETWSELGLSENIIELKEVQRQDNEKFVSLLNKVRVGDVRETDINNLNSKCLISDSNPLPTDGILPTRLYVLNKDVDQENISRLADLEGKEIKCTAVDTWRGSVSTGIPAAIKKKMKESLDMEMPNEVRLKLGAQVMLTRNKDLDRNLVNGSRGVVEGFEDDGGEFLIPIVRFDSGTVTKISPVESLRYGPDGGEGCLVRMQIPLKLAWAITIHKSQGSTLTRALLDITSAFEYGQCYVALSRVKSLEGLWLEKPARLSNVMVSPQVLEFFNGSEII